MEEEQLTKKQRREQRRANREAERLRYIKQRILKKVSLWGISIITIVGFGYWMVGALQDSAEELAKEIEGIQKYTRDDRSHVTGTVDYAETPPVGGPHAGVWLDCNGTSYDTPVIKEQAVHALEHGAVWITYKPDISEGDIAKLEDRMRNYTFMSPMDNQDHPIMLTAWGYQIGLDSVDDERLDQFLRKYRQGPQTPEPGATCNAVPGGMTR